VGVHAIPWLTYAVYAVLAIAISLLSSMAGIGGGVFMVPLFYFLGLGMNEAVGTSKFVITFISLVSVINYLRSGKVNYRVGLVALSTMLPSAYVGAYLSGSLDSSVLKIIVGLFIMLYSVRLLSTYVRKKIRREGERDRYDGGSPPLNTLLKCAFVGLVAGFVAGITGTAGGSVNMPLYTTVLGMPIHYAVATSFFTIFPTAVIATTQHVLHNEVVYDMAVPFVLGSLIGASIGSRLAVKMRPQTLRLIIGCVLLVTSVKMLCP